MSALYGLAKKKLLDADLDIALALTLLEL